RRGTRLPAAYRGIEYMDAFGPKLRLDLPNQRRAAGGEIDVYRPWLYPFQNTLCSQGNRFHFGRARQGSEGHITLARYFGRRRGVTGTPVHQGPGALLAEVVDDHGIIRLLNIAGHAAPHITQPDKSDCLHVSAPVLVGGCLRRVCHMRQGLYRLGAPLMVPVISTVRTL